MSSRQRMMENTARWRAFLRHLSLALIFQGKLRTKFLLSLLLISAALTWATLLLVRPPRAVARS